MRAKASGENGVAKLLMPWLGSSRPLKMPARLVMQMAVEQKLFSKTTPSRANRSTFGVWMIRFPIAPRVSQR